VGITEIIYTSKEMRDAANLILDQVLIQTSGVGIFVELGFAGAGGRLFVTDDPSRLTTIIERISRNTAGGTKIYFLGNA
jgi:hypothetical protein